MDLYNFKDIHNLYYFLTYASTHPDLINERIISHRMGNGESVSCINWEYNIYITGTDIIRVIYYILSFQGYKINYKLLQQGINSNLRNNKNFILEQNYSELLILLKRYNCINTLKKQKIYLWNSVNFNKLINDFLYRSLKIDNIMN